MNEIEVIPNEPVVSSGLEVLISDVFSNPLRWYQCRDLPPTLSAEVRGANAALSKLEMLCAPVNKEHLTNWLEPLVALPNAPADSDFVAAIELIYLAVDSLPWAAFNRDTLRTIAQKSRFWPSPAEVYEVVNVAGYRLTSRRRALETIIKAADKMSASKDQSEPDTFAVPDSEHTSKRQDRGMRQIGQILDSLPKPKPGNPYDA